MINNNALTELQDIIQQLKTYEFYNARYPSVWVKNFIVPIFEFLVVYLTDLDYYIEVELQKNRDEIDERLSKFSEMLSQSASSTSQAISSANNSLSNKIDDNNRRLASEIEKINNAMLKMNEEIEKLKPKKPTGGANV